MDTCRSHLACSCWQVAVRDCAEDLSHIYKRVCSVVVPVEVGWWALALALVLALALGLAKSSPHDPPSRSYYSYSCLFVAVDILVRLDEAREEDQPMLGRLQGCFHVCSEVWGVAAVDIVD